MLNHLMQQICYYIQLFSRNALTILYKIMISIKIIGLIYKSKYGAFITGSLKIWLKHVCQVFLNSGAKVAHENVNSY